MCFEGIEHRTFSAVCTRGQPHCNAFPAVVSEFVQYGERVRAVGVHLTQGQMLRCASAPGLNKEMTSLSVWPAKLHAWVEEAWLALQSGHCKAVRHAQFIAPFRLYAGAILRFIGDLGVPFSNNIA